MLIIALATLRNSDSFPYSVARREKAGDNRPHISPSPSRRVTTKDSYIRRKNGGHLATFDWRKVDEKGRLVKDFSLHVTK